ncbi:MAG: hypothetical protein ABIE07_08095 [Candidatus Zixiibacteriota bacterium]
MENLIDCGHCGAKISDTALKCPTCFKDTGDKETLIKKIGLSAAGVSIGATLLGPVGIATMVVGGFFWALSDRQLKKMAKKLGAIDLFYLTDAEWVLVTETNFVIVFLSGGALETANFLRSDLHKVFIDENKSKSGGFLSKKRTVLQLDFFDTNFRKMEVSYKYKFKGKNSRAEAELVLIKFKEYQTP